MDDAAFIRSRYTYDAKTGVLYHSFGRLSGQAVGCIGKGGYLQSKFRSKHQRVHRLIWLYVYGYWPEIVDHINHNTADNRIENLRSVTRLENQRNRRLSTNNKSGVSGVSWRSSDQRWVAQIKNQGSVKYIGSFKSLDDAVAARRQVETDLGFHENHGAA